MIVNILIADDDPVIRELIKDIIHKLGYNPITASNGKQAIDLFFNNKDIALCIIDVMMPIYNGWEVLSYIREHSDVPVIILTALSEEYNEVKGLTIGADDYISKPFSYQVFIARIEALLRKTKRSFNEVINIGNLSINKQTHTVLINNVEIQLNNKEYKLLLFLISNKNMIVDRDTIINKVWGYNFDGDIRTVDAHIKMIRSKLGSCSNYIKTVRGTGYIFEVE